MKEIDLRQVLSDTKFFEGYSRFNNETKRYETWEEATTRVMQMHKEFYKDKLSPQLNDLLNEAEEAYKNRLVLGSQRALQFGGEQLLRKHMRLYNCTSTYVDRVQFFGELFWILLCGSGAGFSVQKHHVSKLPMIRPRTKQPKTFIIDDSIEGWAKSVDVLLSSFFIGGGVHPEYEGRRVYFDYSKIRPRGAHISGGFKAPGPEPLQKAISLIEKILIDRAEDGILRPIDAYDISMHIANAVLSGGVRRSATICLFSLDDEDMLKAKIGNWFAENPQRARSNNSVVLKRDEISQERFLEIMKYVKEFGEPGFVFTESYEHTFNPCLEIGMLPKTADGKSGWQGCNLTEINGSKIKTAEDFMKAAKAAAILGTLQAGYTDFEFLGTESKEIFEREALLGCSITGWMNSPKILFDEGLIKQATKIIKDTNKEVAKLIGIRQAARTTCVKPSGNASVLLGTASGIHPEHSKKYIRNIQINKDQEIGNIIKKFNPYMVEESVWSATKSDYVISFPIIPPKESIVKNGLSAVAFLEKVKHVQQTWVEYGTNLDVCVDKTLRHNVSNTVVVKENEWEEVAHYIYDNRKFYCGVSLISDTGDKDYYQAPNTSVLDPKELVTKYGEASFFASGLIVDAVKSGFPNLWEAIRISTYNGDDSSQEMKDNREDWIRRFKKFGKNYFEDDLIKTGYCLKDVYLLHRWSKIQLNYQPMDLENLLIQMKEIDIDTMGAQACSGPLGCEIL